MIPGITRSLVRKRCRRLSRISIRTGRVLYPARFSRPSLVANQILIHRVFRSILRNAFLLDI